MRSIKHPLRRTQAINGIFWSCMVAFPLAAAPPKVPLDSIQTRRVAEFVAALSYELPVLVRGDTARSFSRLSNADEVQMEHLDWGGSATRRPFLGQYWSMDTSPMSRVPTPNDVASAIAGLDSLRPIWQTTGAPARRVWLLYDNGLQKVVGMLLMLRGTPEVQRAVVQFADAALMAGKEPIHRENADALTAVGTVLTGAVAVAQGDSVHAMTVLFRTVETPRTFVSLPAARLLSALAAARRDTTHWLQALTLQHLETSWPDSISRQADAQLQTVFAQAVASGHPLPDLQPDRVHDDPPLPARPTLDSYVDRQWSGLYDRELPVTRSMDAPADPSRLVVVEYITGLACGGCWFQDRGLQALLRRYPASDVIPLAYHNWMPVVSYVDSLWSRFATWYPPNTGYTYRSHKVGSSTLPSKLLVGASGDTLNWEAWVNGHALPYDPVGEGYPAGQNYYRPAVTLIDRDLKRPAVLPIRVDAALRHDSVQIVVNVDAAVNTTAHPAHPVALRIVLYQDTVWMHGGTIRRIYTNVVRAAVQDDTLSLGLPLQLSRPATVHYAFDVAALQDALMIIADPKRVEALGESRRVAEDFRETYARPHPDPRDWQIDRTRLHVVAMVQDLTTGDMLGAAHVKVH